MLSLGWPTFKKKKLFRIYLLVILCNAFAKFLFVSFYFFAGNLKSQILHYEFELSSDEPFLMSINLSSHYSPSLISSHLSLPHYANALDLKKVNNFSIINFNVFFCWLATWGYATGKMTVPLNLNKITFFFSTIFFKVDTLKHLF